MKTLKLKRHESFSLRDGWIEKYLVAVRDGNKDVFVKNNGIRILGIGSNMVKSLKYWLIASNIVSGDNKATLTDFGNLILTYDPFLESSLSILLVHYFLCSKRGKEWENVDAPVFCSFFNVLKSTSTTKEEVKENLLEFFTDQGYDINIDSLVSDISVLFRMYSNDDFAVNPEDNYSSPLAKLKLLVKQNRNHYNRYHDPFLDLHPIVIYFILSSLYGKREFEIGDAFACEDSPARIFNLDKSTFFLYLMELKRMGFVDINKTAGLDIVYPIKQIAIQDVFESYFGGMRNV